MHRTRPTHAHRDGGRLRAGSRVALAACLAVGLAGVALAEPNPFGGPPTKPHVYHSRFDDGIDWFGERLPLGTHSFNLYVTAGAHPSTLGTPCLTGTTDGGDGDELCAFAVQLKITGAGYIKSWTEDPGLGGRLVSVPDEGVYTTPFPMQLDLNFVDYAAPLQAGPDLTGPGRGTHRIGTLQIEITGNDTTLSVFSGTSVRASVQRLEAAEDTMQPGILAIPEPGQVWLMLSALGGLALCHRLRALRGR